jgi:ABC-type uncharacterized transport system permease subunit
MVQYKPVSVLAAIIFAAAALSGPVRADSTQQNKNLWRNLGIGAAAVGVAGLANHNSTEALAGAAGAAYSASRYEQERRTQSRERAARRARWYHLHHRYHH